MAVSEGRFGRDLRHPDGRAAPATARYTRYDARSASSEGLHETSMPSAAARTRPRPWQPARTRPCCRRTPPPSPRSPRRAALRLDRAHDIAPACFAGRDRRVAHRAPPPGPASRAGGRRRPAPGDRPRTRPGLGVGVGVGLARARATRRGSRRARGRGGAGDTPGEGDTAGEGGVAGEGVRLGPAGAGTRSHRDSRSAWATAPASAAAWAEAPAEARPPAARSARPPPSAARVESCTVRTSTAVGPTSPSLTFDLTAAHERAGGRERLGLDAGLSGGHRRIVRRAPSGEVAGAVHAQQLDPEHAEAQPAGGDLGRAEAHLEAARRAGPA